MDADGNPASAVVRGLALAKDEGIELTDEQLEALAGGTAITAGTYNFNNGLWGRVTD